jgi:hypothetical protein
MKRSSVVSMIMLITVLGAALIVRAQEQTRLAATLEVLKAGVEVKRVDTPNWIAIKIEAIVGVGDEIRTDATGSARITFFADGVDTDLLPNTVYRIEEFKGEGDSFTLNAQVLIGQTTQRLGRTLDASSSYNITTPGMILAARGTEFAIRVEESGRAGMLVQKGVVAAENEEDEAKIPPEFGIRAAPDEALSDVVKASTFAELDAALDGCAAQIKTVDDVRLNVRLGPNLTMPRVGTVDPAELTALVGISSTDRANTSWYRVPFNGGYGWVLSSSATIAADCAGLRTFTPDWREDASQYEALGETIILEDTAPAGATAEPTVEATSEGE